MSILVIAFSLSSCALFMRTSNRGGGGYNKTDGFYCSALYSYKKYVNTNPKLESDFLDLIKRFSPEGYFAVNRVRHIAKKRCGEYGNEYVWYLSGIKKGKPQVKPGFKEMLNDLPTAIHETVHSFVGGAHWFDDSLLIGGASNKNSYFFKNPPYGRISISMDGKSVYYIPRTKTFVSRKITPYIKNKIVLKEIRYKTYIDPASPYHVTQQFGVYGLLNEFFAYYHSVLASTNIIVKVPQKKRRIAMPEWGKNSFIITSNNNSYISYLQFKLYILTYFRVAQKKYPAIYSGLMNNKKLLKGFVVIEKRFRKQYEKYRKVNKKLLSFEKDNKAHMEELNRPENRMMFRKIQETLKL